MLINEQCSLIEFKVDNINSVLKSTFLSLRLRTLYILNRLLEKNYLSIKIHDSVRDRYTPTATKRNQDFTSFTVHSPADSSGLKRIYCSSVRLKNAIH